MTIHPADIEDVEDLRRQLAEVQRERDEAIRERDRLRRRLAYVQMQVGFAVDELRCGRVDQARRRLDRKGVSMKERQSPSQ
ncbi:hypothetical protein ABIE78_001234 [Sinorhizobium fredii]|uniref:Uncharacterized protein n=1 Tax=Sinorhizobium fredii (strain USDA 257) TaxID=1185652 RepID=I3XBA9_SINF2|nr:hypothetical protein [Sinorhizobium fredii]AFL52875.1 hypothetical protein USDA257_c43360 [Sinorhizobium fredii USDA 257]AFL53165.1 hypothetical protein USDA257_c46270 [Sinorhizobium fredii USDA 257]